MIKVPSISSLKIPYLSFILTMIVFLFLGFGQAHADKDVYVQNIKVQPSAVKLGDTFTVTATLVNNSTGPIWVVGGKCSVKDTEAELLTVTFDNHAKIKTKSGLFCAGVGWYQKLDPGQNLTTTTPDYTSSFVATESGTANGKIKFSYHIFNLTDPTQPGYDGSISQSFQFAISDQSGSKSENVYGGGGPVVRITLDPLQQSKTGVAPKDVKCNEGFQLVIKAKDGSPACLKPDAADILLNHGWAKGFTQSVMATNQSTCDGTKVPSRDFRDNTFPVLVMRPNSTATVCVTYNFMSDWQKYHNKDVYTRGILETWHFVNMGGYYNPALSNKFEIMANPPLFNVTGVTNGSKVSVTYKIYAKPDSKGFYDTSVPFDGCDSYPMAVGYGLSEINASKFHNTFDIPCFAFIENVDSVKIISGINYTMVDFH